MALYDKGYFDGGRGYSEYKDDGRLKELARWIKDTYNPTSVLDFGCAKGFLVKHLRDLGVEAWGSDVSEYALDSAPEEVKDFLFLGLSPRQVELIVSNDTLEHIPEEELDNLRDYFRHVGKKFWFRVGTVNTPNWQHDPTHVTIKPLQFWKDWMPEAEWIESK